jgi:para-nitrobenzyl esterase
VRPSVGGAAFPTDPAVAVPAGRFNRVPVLLGQASSERSLFTFQNYDYLGKPLTAEQYVAFVTSTYRAKAAKVLTEYPVRCSATSTRTLRLPNSSSAHVRQRVDTRGGRRQVGLVDVCRGGRFVPL